MFAVSTEQDVHRRNVELHHPTPSTARISGIDMSSTKDHYPETTLASSPSGGRHAPPSISGPSATEGGSEIAKIGHFDGTDPDDAEPTERGFPNAVFEDATAQSTNTAAPVNRSGAFPTVVVDPPRLSDLEKAEYISLFEYSRSLLVSLVTPNPELAEEDGQPSRSGGERSIAGLIPEANALINRRLVATRSGEPESPATLQLLLDAQSRIEVAIEALAARNVALNAAIKKLKGSK